MNPQIMYIKMIMKKCEEVKMLPRRRDAALAVPYKTDEFTDSSEEKKSQKQKKFTSASLKDKYFKL
ncbi:hypothetical protein S675_005595 [Salmonella enterica subsp. enterica]|nr:hypothetical protein [Salmonella enterica subsp. enterica]